MYAIRSYYGSDALKGVFVKMKKDDTETVGEKNNEQPEELRVGSVTPVITSYSIHYTKLYDKGHKKR